jgi:hypothetical protein
MAVFKNGRIVHFRRRVDGRRSDPTFRLAPLQFYSHSWCWFSRFIHSLSIELPISSRQKMSISSCQNWKILRDLWCVWVRLVDSDNEHVGVDSFVAEWTLACHHHNIIPT